MISFKNVSKKFGTIVALSNVSFNVEPGEFVFITGSSGSGKTTVLRLILRDILPDSGEIKIWGKNIASLKGRDISLHRRNIGMVFQDFKLLADRTIGENVGLALSVAGMPQSKRQSRIKEALTQVGLKDRSSSFPVQLAGGELQRAVVARAIIGAPKLILADEPTGNLDQDTAWGIVELLEKIRGGGTTVIMATHNREIVDKMHSHVIELREGRAVRDKTSAKYKDSED